MTPQIDPPTSDGAHSARAVELIRLCLLGRTNEAELLLGTVPAEDAHGLAAAAVLTASVLCEHTAGKETALLTLAAMKGGLDA